MQDKKIDGPNVRAGNFKTKSFACICANVILFNNKSHAKQCVLIDAKMDKKNG